MGCPCKSGGTLEPQHFLPAIIDYCSVAPNATMSRMMGLGGSLFLHESYVLFIPTQWPLLDCSSCQRLVPARLALLLFSCSLQVEAECKHLLGYGLLEVSHARISVDLGSSGAWQK